MMNNITKQNRLDSYRSIRQFSQRRRDTILSMLKENGAMTAQEIATNLFANGYTPSEDRNFAAPRLTELKEAGKVKPVGKKVCQKTGRNVTIWQAESQRD